MSVVSDNQLTDVTTLRKWLVLDLSGKPSVDTPVDENLLRLILAVSKTFKTLINTPILIEGNYSDTFLGNNQRRYYTKARPVTAVSSLAENTRIISPSSTPYQGSGYSFDKFGIYYPERFSSLCIYSLSYTGGVSLNSPEAFEAEQAVLSLCNLWWKRRTHADQLAQSQGNQVSIKFTEAEIPPETSLIIKAMKRVV